MAEEQAISFALDGKAVSAAPGETVLSVARRHQIEIPALCHHEAVASYGACRLCVVEVFRGKRSRLVTSCIYMPSENDSIQTRNDRVCRARRIILELLLARCPEVEVLRNLASQYRVESTRFRPREDLSSTEKHCILCGLCVRVCSEVMKQHAIGFANRGAKRMIATPFDAGAEACIGCGACVFVCPTGALHYEDIDGERVMKEFKVRLPLVKCQVCGRSFAVAKQVAGIRQRLKLLADLAETCPSCRSTLHRNAMAAVFGLKQSRY